jgi:hypothetical protein
VGDCHDFGSVERKGLCTRQDLYDIIAEFRRKNPRANIPETAFPEPYLLTEKGNKIIDDMLDLFYTNGVLGNLIQARPLSSEKGVC